MDSEQALQMLTAQNRPVQISQWLRDVYFPEVIARYNSENSRKKFALYQNEQVPTNERNLTDVRTRLGVLIEFELSRISNELLLELGINDIFWSYVIANRFPDLEARRNDGEKLLRLEIKCLQCVAEEKAANFDTLIKDINPYTDFVAVCLWDWEAAGAIECSWDKAPKIFKIYVFNAYALAKLRDSYWLNRPPTNLGNGCQGFDIRHAVTCANGRYSKEQGNYGKLTRIWREGFTHRPASDDVLTDTEQEYCAFQKEIILAGFKILSHGHLHLLCKDDIEVIQINGRLAGYKAGHIAYILSNVMQHKHIVSYASDNDISFVVSMTEKYKCTIYSSGRVIGSGQKPKAVIDIINRYGN
jgi:hypothetical protein